MIKIKGDTKKYMIYIYANNDIQFDGSFINVDVRFKTMEATARDPENSGWYKTI